MSINATIDEIGAILCRTLVNRKTKNISP
ncbi:hypothetical protein DSL72_006212 [Monilinia vaccinii-corymbosi]|uniref:Uncharacterized protein n=1 Tax=Monilinia vaccinii-corymbosi TaxID=61207 RepID=A0A8A3PHA2_9HELO|nr:hypothetical protein DSL72_006212 [Monilinia vaccinii-corymbosi]